MASIKKNNDESKAHLLKKISEKKHVILKELKSSPWISIGYLI